MKKSKAFKVSETITFTTQIGAYNKADATNRFFEYMGGLWGGSSCACEAIFSKKIEFFLTF